MLFEGRVSSINQIFTEEDQNRLLCETVIAENNPIFQNSEVYNVSISTEDSAVILSPARTSILVLDDDGKKHVTH